MLTPAPAAASSICWHWLSIGSSSASPAIVTGHTEDISRSSPTHSSLQVGRTCAQATKRLRIIGCMRVKRFGFEVRTVLGCLLPDWEGERWPGSFGTQAASSNFQLRGKGRARSQQ